MDNKLNIGFKFISKMDRLAGNDGFANEKLEFFYDVKVGEELKIVDYNAESDIYVLQNKSLSSDGAWFKVSETELNDLLFGKIYFTEPTEPSIPAELELTNEMLSRQDDIDNAVHACVCVLAEKDIDWDMEMIGDVRDSITAVLYKEYGVTVRDPGIVTETDGSEHFEHFETGMAKEIIMDHMNIAILGGVEMKPNIKILDPTRQIAIIWSIDDVKSVSPHLTDSEALAVLQGVGHEYVAKMGITFDTIRAMSEELYPMEDAMDKVFKEVGEKQVTLEAFKKEIEDAVEKYGNDRVVMYLSNNGMFYGSFINEYQVTGLCDEDETDTFAMIDLCHELAIEFRED